MRDETPGSTSETLLLGLAMFEVGSECCLARERGGIGSLRDWVEVEFLGDMFEVLVALEKEIGLELDVEERKLERLRNLFVVGK